jgi:hypothetical protein
MSSAVILGFVRGEHPAPGRRRFRNRDDPNWYRVRSGRPLRDRKRPERRSILSNAPSGSFRRASGGVPEPHVPGPCADSHGFVRAGRWVRSGNGIVAPAVPETRRVRLVGRLERHLGFVPLPSFLTHQPRTFHRAHLAAATVRLRAAAGARGASGVRGGARPPLLSIIGRTTPSVLRSSTKNPT